MKALFIPLAGQYYDQFEDGSKDTEYRAFGPRWNFNTCTPGREVILSRGYGKKKRMHGVVVSANIVPPTPAFTAIYGEGRQCFAIKIAELKGLPHGN